MDHLTLPHANMITFILNLTIHHTHQHLLHLPSPLLTLLILLTLLTLLTLLIHLILLILFILVNLMVIITSNLNYTSISSTVDYLLILINSGFSCLIMISFILKSIFIFFIWVFSEGSTYADILMLNFADLSNFYTHVFSWEAMISKVFHILLLYFFVSLCSFLFDCILTLLFVLY